MEPIDAKDVIEGVTTRSLSAGRVTRVVAIFTALFALFASVGSLMAARCSTRGMLFKNDAILRQEELTNNWSYYQSKNVRSEILSLLAREAKSEKIEELEAQKKDLIEKGHSLEKQRDELNHKSNQYLDVAKTFASALAFFQSGLILVPLTLLVEQIVLLFTGMSLGGVGFVLMIQAFIQYFKVL